MSPDTRRAALERNLELAEAGGYTYIVENNRRLLATLDAREEVTAVTEVTPPGAEVGTGAHLTAAERARSLRSLIWYWLPEEPEELSTSTQLEPTAAEQRATALALLEQVRDAQQFLAAWTDRLIRVASENDATNPAIGAALGVGKERIRRRLLKEPGSA